MIVRSVSRAAQTHKVPRKSLRNWMKRCHIKSSFPMPQQLKQFVENSKKQRDYQHQENDKSDNVDDNEFGKHFLFNQVSSEDEVRDKTNASDGNIALDMSLHE